MTNTKMKPATALQGRRIILQGGYVFEVEHQHAEHLDVLERRANAYPQLVARIHNNIAVHDEMDDDGMNIRCTCQQCGANRELLRSLGELE